MGSAPRVGRAMVVAAALGLLVTACGGGAATVPSGSPAAVVAPTASPSDSPAADLASASDAPSDSPADSPPEPSPSTADPCALITIAEANAVAGVKTLPPEAAGDPPDECVWATPTSGAVGQVQIDVGDGAKKAYDIDKTVLKHAFTVIAGLGDEGYAEDGAVFFRKGDTWVAIDVVRLDDSKVWMPKLEALAKTVATRV